MHSVSMKKIKTVVEELFNRTGPEFFSFRIMTLEQRETNCVMLADIFNGEVDLEQKYTCKVNWSLNLSNTPYTSEYYVECSWKWHIKNSHEKKMSIFCVAVLDTF